MTKPKVSWFPVSRGGALAASRSTRRAVEEALAGAVLAGPELVTADLARSAADVVDAARRAQDPRLWLTAASRLEQLLGRLPIRPVADTGGEVKVDGGSERRGDDPAAWLEEIMGRAADVGDGAES